MKHFISIIIVNYNTKDVLKKCLENLLSIGLDIEVIVVDNGSSDGSYQMIKDNFKSVKAIKEENKGISHGYNTGIKHANSDTYLFMGSDAFPDKKSLEGCYSYLINNKNVGVVTAELVLRNGKIDMDAHRGLPTPWASITHFLALNKLFPKSKFFNQYFLGYKDMSKPHQIGLCISHFMMVKKDVFTQVKNWDEDFFVYGEDVDFCYRVQQAGWKIMYLPQFKVKHLKGVSVGTRKETKDIASKVDKKTKIERKKWTTNAMKLFYKKHYTNKYPKLLTGIVLLGITILEKIRTL